MILAGLVFQLKESILQKQFLEHHENQINMLNKDWNRKKANTFKNFLKTKESIIQFKIENVLSKKERNIDCLLHY